MSDFNPINEIVWCQPEIENRLKRAKTFSITDDDTLEWAKAFRDGVSRGIREYHPRLSRANDLFQVLRDAEKIWNQKIAKYQGREKV